MLFWVGCMASFDDRAKKIAVAFARILNAAGIRFAILAQGYFILRWGAYLL